MRATFGLALFVLGLAFSAIAALAGAFGAAVAADSPAVFLSAGLIAVVLASVITASVAAWLLRYRRRRITVLVYVGITVVLVLSLAQYLFLTPLIDDTSADSRPLPEGAAFWKLATGSTIALRKIEGRRTGSRPPIVFLHGGPGAYSVAFAETVEVISALADDGHDVYFYDQIGGGLSARLQDVTQYSLERHLADLDAIYERIGSERIVLIGSSFGATLGAAYLAAFPEKVAAAVFSGAAPMFHPGWADIGDGKLDDVLSPSQRAQLARMIEKPRLFAAIGLARLNPNAAAHFAPDAELGALFDRVANEIYIPATVCAGNNSTVRSEGYGFWSNRMTGRSLSQQRDDPRPRLREVRIPVLILRGECDYKKEEVAREYASVIPNAEFVSVQGAGHMPYLDRPEEYVTYVRQFLRATRSQPQE